MHIAGRTVLVTGANRGLGRELVMQLLGRGVAGVYATARDLRTVDVHDPRVVPLQLDVTDPVSIARAAETATGVEIVVNNAGIASATSVLERDTSTLRRELETNLFGPIAVTAAFAARLPDTTGAVVTIASVASWIGLAGTYGVSKAAVWMATDAMRLELAPRGIQVVSVHVAQVDTDLTAGSTAPKSDPAVIVRRILDGVEAGAVEVIADDLSREVRRFLPDPIEAQLARFAPHAS